MMLILMAYFEWRNKN